MVFIENAQANAPGDNQLSTGHIFVTNQCRKPHNFERDQQPALHEILLDCLLPRIN